MFAAEPEPAVRVVALVGLVVRGGGLHPVVIGDDPSVGGGRGPRLPGDGDQGGAVAERAPEGVIACVLQFPLTGQPLPQGGGNEVIPVGELVQGLWVYQVQHAVDPFGDREDADCLGLGEDPYLGESRAVRAYRDRQAGGSGVGVGLQEDGLGSLGEEDEIVLGIEHEHRVTGPHCVEQKYGSVRTGHTGAIGPHGPPSAAGPIAGAQRPRGGRERASPPQAVVVGRYTVYEACHIVGRSLTVSQLSGFVLSVNIDRTSLLAPLRAGQVRRLSPPAGWHAEPRLVLLLDGPQPGDLPEDISVTPGPCRLLHVVLLGSGHGEAATWDLCLPTSTTGTPYPLYAMLDTFTTVRLDLDPAGDAERFGPPVGNRLPKGLVDLAWAASIGDMTEIRSHLESLGPDWHLGSLVPQPGDHLWMRRSREVTNLHGLMAWW